MKHHVLTFVLLAAGAPVVAFAQDGGAPDPAETAGGAASTPQAVDGGATLAPEEQAELERALQADMAAAEDGPAPAQPGAVGRVLESVNPDISFVGDVALGWFSTDEPLQTGGHDPQKTGFTLQQLEMAVSSVVDPYFRFDAFLVFSQFGVEVEEVYATTLALPWNLQVRLGQLLTRFGRQNATHPHSWDFVDQPFPLGRVFGGENNRGLGFEASYLTPLPWYGELIYSVTDAAGEATARSFYGAQDLGVQTPFDFQHTLVFKQFFPLSDDWSLLWGLSGASGPNPTGHRNRTEVFGTDLYVKYRPLSGGSSTVVSLQTEVFYRRRQVPDDVLQDVSGYSQLFWRFAQRWGTAARYEYGSPAWQLGGERGDDYLDPDWTDHRHRLSANVTFWPTEFSRARLQASSDLPGWRAEPNWAVFLAFEFSVGAHGAHAF